jgi:hypothetical protein
MTMSARVINKDVLDKFTRRSMDQQKDRDKEHTGPLANKEAGAVTTILAPARKADMMENFMMNSLKTRIIEDGPARLGPFYTYFGWRGFEGGYTLQSMCCIQGNTAARSYVTDCLIDASIRNRIVTVFSLPHYNGERWDANIVAKPKVMTRLQFFGYPSGGVK